MTSNKKISKMYFTRRDDDANLWLCKCGKELTKKKGTGWSNLMHHIKSQHPVYSQRNKQSLSKFVTENPSTSNTVVSRSALNAFGWIELICICLKPFSFVEDPTIRKYINLGSMNNVTLKKYMTKLTLEVEKKITKELPGKFALIIDGWSKGSTHFVGLFASYPWNNRNGYRTALLTFSPLENETSFTAADHVDFIKYTLSIYEKNLENVVALIGDNAEVNKSMAKLLGIPLIGCASHKFNLAVSAYLEKDNILLNKTNQLMGRLKTYKLAGKLRELTPLKPVQKNVTRWSSTFEMIERFIQLEPFFGALRDDAKLIDYLLTPREENDL